MTGRHKTRFNKSSPGKTSYKVSNTVKELETLKEVVAPASPFLRERLPSTKRGLSSSSSEDMGPDKKAPDISSDSDKLLAAFKHQMSDLRSSMSAEFKDLGSQIGNVNHDIASLRKDVQSLDIKMESRISNLEDRQEASDVRQDKLERKVEDLRDTVEGEIASLKQLIETGSTTLSNGTMSYDELHERYLLNQLNEARNMVTVFNAGKESLSPLELGELLVLQGFITKADKRGVLSSVRMGGAFTKSHNFIVKLETASLAQVLLEKSRSGVRAAAEGNHVRIFPFVPTPYAAKHRDFREMGSALQSIGYQTNIEFEGTTMILKAKERSPAGQWCIVQGGSFKPPTTGREAATESEDALVARAREKMLQSLAGGGPSPLANSISIVTKDSLVDEESIFQKIGAEAKENFVKYDKITMASGVKNHYRVFYTNRAAAMAAIKVIQGNDEAIRKTSPTDSFRLDLPWVPKAPKASSPPPPSAPTSVLPTPTGLGVS